MRHVGLDGPVEALAVSEICWLCVSMRTNETEHSHPSTYETGRAVNRAIVTESYVIIGCRDGRERDSEKIEQHAEEG